MGMTIEELIEEEQDIVNIHQNIIDHYCEVTEDMSLEEMEFADECQSRNQWDVNYHNQIIDILRKYQKIEDVYYHQSGEALENSLRAVIEDGNVD